MTTGQLSGCQPLSTHARRAPTTVASVRCHAGRSPWYAVVFGGLVDSRVTTTYWLRRARARRDRLDRAAVGDPAAPQLVVAGGLRGGELHRRAGLADAAAASARMSAATVWASS